MISSDLDLKSSKSFELSKKKQKNFFMSKLYYDEKISIVSNFIGAPYAVLLLENLIVCGAKQVLFFGSCGAINKDIKIGDIIIPNSALVGEGVSNYYSKETLSFPNDELKSKTEEFIKNKGLSFKNGKIWTTSAFYMETKEKIKELQDEDIIALEMELSALFTVAKFRKISLSAFLIVSDELYHQEWKSGFYDSTFQSNKKKLLHSISSFIEVIDTI